MNKNIDRRFLHYETRDAFLRDKDDISNNSIVFIDEGRTIYTHGEEYAGDNVPALSEYLKSEDAVDLYADKENVYTKEEVDVKISLIQAGEEVSLAGYYTKGEVDDKLADKQPVGNYLTEHQSLEDYALKTDIPELQDLSGYITAEETESIYAKKTDIPTIPTNVSSFVNDADYQTQQLVDDKLATKLPVGDYLTEHQDLSAYATKTEVLSETERAIGQEDAIRNLKQDIIADLELIRSKASTALQPADYNELNNRLLQLEQLIESDHNGAINKFNEIVSFLKRISDTTTLDSIVNGISTLISSLLNTKQNNITAGEGIDITEDVVSVKDYIGEAEINLKLNTLLQMLGEIYVLKDDVYKDESTQWSTAPVYSFGNIPASTDNLIPNKSDICALDEHAFNVLQLNNQVRNDVCYLITD